MNNIRALLIGESWGRTELDFKHPFVGYSGQELARMGGEAGLFPPLNKTCKHCAQTVQFGRCENCGAYNSISPLEIVHFWAKTKNTGIGVTNVFQEHPDKDNIELFFNAKSEDVSLDYGFYKRNTRNFYPRKEFAHHIENLYDEIQTLKPNLLIPLGNTACWAILGQVKITDLRGTIQNTKWNIKALPTYHPAALRKWPLRPLIISDFKKAAKECEDSLIHRDPIWLEAENTTLEDIESWFKIRAHRYTVDIESGFVLFSKAELNQMKIYAPKARNILAQLISMVGFARNGEEGLVIQFLKRNQTNGQVENYWPTQSHTVQAWQWIQYGLSTGAELAFQNGMYDVNRLLCAGMRPKNMAHDSMLRQHSMLPEMLKGLGFLASIHLDGMPSWKTMYGQGESLKRDD